MTTKRVTTTLTMLLLALFIVSCGGGAKQAEENETVSKEEAFKSVTKYPLPTAFEVTKMLNKAGASYIISLNNPIENVDKYFTEKSKALNLGVYGANLSYASTYQMKQETMNYLKVSKKLIDELQITTAFNAKFAERIESNIDNKDSLILIISDSFYDTYDFLVKNGKDNISLLVMSGSWIEGLYITTQIAIVSKNNEDFLKIIANQKDPLSKLMELIEPVATDPTIAEIKGMLMPLHEAFSKVQGENLTQAQLDEITEVASKIRMSII